MRASDLILHAGDFTYPEALRDLEVLGPPVAAVHVNPGSPTERRREPGHTMGVARIHFKPVELD